MIKLENLIDLNGLDHAIKRVKDLIAYRLQTLKASDIGAIPSDPAIRTTIPEGTDLAVYFSDATKPWGSYYGCRDSNLTNAPLSAADFWFFDRTPSGIYARCASDLARLWWASTMNGTFGGWEELSTTTNVSGKIDAHNLATTAHSDIRQRIDNLKAAAVPITRKVNDKALSGDITLFAVDVGAKGSNNNSLTTGSIKTWATNMATSFSIGVQRNVTDMPEDGAYWFVDLIVANSGMWRKLTATKTDSSGGRPVTYECTCMSGTWSDWTSIATTSTYTAEVTTSWTESGDYFYQDITVSGILATDNPIVDINPGSDNAANAIYSENMCKVLRITTSANEIRVWATEAIASAFPIQLKVVR